MIATGYVHGRATATLDPAEYFRAPTEYGRKATEFEVHRVTLRPGYREADMIYLASGALVNADGTVGLRRAVDHTLPAERVPLAVRRALAQELVQALYDDYVQAHEYRVALGEEQQ